MARCEGLNALLKIVEKPPVAHHGGLLDYTHGVLLDVVVVGAFESGDSATVCRAVDRVVQTGQDHVPVRG